MNSQSKELEKVYLAFPSSYTNQNNEMIIYPKRNTYFLLDNVSNEMDLDCKILEWLSRETIRSSSPTSRRYHLDGINRYFKKDFTAKDMELIYRRIGNGINRKLCVKFIESGLDMSILTKEELKQ